jgi:hypothetical protein
MAEKFQAGSRAIVCGAHGQPIDADIIRVRPDGTADLVLMHNGQEMEIHKSPRDDSGTKPDSWRPAPTPYDTLDAAEASAADQSPAAGTEPAKAAAVAPQAVTAPAAAK